MFTQSLDIPNALRLDKQSVDALLRGDIIAAIPLTYTNIGKTFALYPDQQDVETVEISAWARCEYCDIVDESKPLEIISYYAAIPTETLQKVITERESFFLIYLRVYQLPKPIKIPARSKGQYIALSDRLKVDDSSPVLSDRDFARIRQKLENLEPPESLDSQIQRMLEEAEIEKKVDSGKKLAWIKTISTLGDRSIKEDIGKSNYQAGTDFENIAKKGLEFLGFTIDESHTGGAGGLDLFCSKPYPIAGECKAGKSIPDNTVEQLNRIAKRHLKNHHLAIGLIIGASEPKKQLRESALASKDEVGMKINIIKAMTLQKLVELKAKYDGAINLFELRKYLQTGQVDNKIEEYIQKVEGEIKLRSHVVNLVKKSNREIGIDYIFGVYESSEYPKPLTDEELFEILIELSSPLAGYLGRVKGNERTGDRFYYLRDLPI